MERCCSCHEKCLRNLEKDLKIQDDIGTMLQLLPSVEVFDRARVIRKPPAVTFFFLSQQVKLAFLCFGPLLRLVRILQAQSFATRINNAVSLGGCSLGTVYSEHSVHCTLGS